MATGIDLNNISIKSQKVAVIFGNEVKGISKDILKLSNKIVEINQHGMKKSMNVSVVAGIVLWTIKNKP